MELSQKMQAFNEDMATLLRKHELSGVAGIVLYNDMPGLFTLHNGGEGSRLVITDLYYLLTKWLVDAGVDLGEPVKGINLPPDEKN